MSGPRPREVKGTESVTEVAGNARDVTGTRFYNEWGAEVGKNRAGVLGCTYVRIDSGC